MAEFIAFFGPRHRSRAHVTNTSLPDSPSAVPPTPPSARKKDRFAYLAPVINTPRRRAQQSEDKTPTKRHRSEHTLDIDIPQSLLDAPAIAVNFDGAYRAGIGAASCGVFIHSYDFHLSAGTTLPDAKTNQQAEISAATQALKAIRRIANTQLHNKFILRGDASHVIDSISSGRILQFEPHCQLPNAQLWLELKREYDSLIAFGVDISLRWIPRRFNVEADELANAALDKRQPRAEVVSPQNILNVDLDSSVEAALKHIATSKRRTFKHLPLDLAKSWRQFLYWAITNGDMSISLRRKIFILAPHLLSAYSHRISNQSMFKELRLHISRLREVEYLAQAMQDILLPQPVSIHKQCSEEARIKTLASVGLFSKIATSEDEVSLADPASINDLKGTLDALFPQSELPDPLPLPATHVVQISYPQLAFAVKHLGKGKAAGPSGWTKELLLPLLHAPPPAVQQALASIFSQILAVEALAEEERQVLTTSWCALLKYKSKPDKLRPIALRECLAKVLWTHLICNNKDCLATAGGSYGKKGGCAAVAIALQKLLDDDKFIVSLDCHNAFNACNRHAAFAYIASRGPIYYDATPFINLFYASASFTLLTDLFGKCVYVQKITTGASQGCSSGPWFFHISVIRVLRKFNNCLLNVADDLYFFEQPEGNQKLITEIVEEFGSLNLHTTGSKTKILCSTSAINRVTTSGICALFANRTDIICPTPCIALGTILIPDSALAFANNGVHLNSVISLPLHKSRAALRYISDMPATKQIKFLTIRTVQFRWLYLISSAAELVIRHIVMFLEDLLAETLYKLIGISTPVHHFLTFTPLEEGGLGFLPLGDLAKPIRTHSYNAAAQILDDLKVKHAFVRREAPPLRVIWKQAAKQLRAAAKFRPQEFADHHSWLTSWPSNHFRRASDTDFTFALQFLLRQLPLVEYTCIFKGKTFSYHLASPVERHAHFLSCNRCGAGGFHTRHEQVLKVFKRTCDFHSHVCEENPKNLPVPGKSKGGPDFILLAKSSLVGDVRIAKARRLKACYTLKVNQYKQFSPAMNAMTLPFVMSTTGTFFRDTLAILKQQLPSQMVTDIILNCQFSLFKAMSSSYARLSVKASDKEFDQSSFSSGCNATDDDLNSDDDSNAEQ